MICGTLSAQTQAFLDIGVNPRSEALGATQFGSGANALSIFTNPAQLAQISGLRASTVMTQWIADITHYGGAMTYNLGTPGTIGLTGIWMDYGTFTRTTGAPGTADGYATTGEFSVTEYAIGVAYAHPLTSKLSLGGHLQYAALSLPTIASASGTVSDQATKSQMVFHVGTVYTPGWKHLRLGAHLQQSGLSPQGRQGALMPGQMTLGGALDLLEFLPGTGWARSSDLTLAYDWLQDRGARTRQHLGLEYALQDVLFLRGGYRFGYDQQGLTAGLGVRMLLGTTALQVDYAYSDFGTYFGTVHRFGCGVALW
ncbi:MAG TPA: PorV/PorQ family protein [bacterium]|nr:PorV/PorQ family protein [bacterium]